MPKYIVEIAEPSRIIEADNEDDAIEEFLAQFPVHEHLIVTELDPPVMRRLQRIG